LGLKEEWAAGRGDAGNARGVKGPFPDFGCWAESLGILGRKPRNRFLYYFSENTLSAKTIPGNSFKMF
jgi:hypothetical protein